MATVMTTYHAHFGGHLVAKCPTCQTICVYWEEEDLDDDGNIVCHCESN